VTEPLYTIDLPAGTTRIAVMPPTITVRISTKAHDAPDEPPVNDGPKNDPVPAQPKDADGGDEGEGPLTPEED